MTIISVNFYVFIIIIIIIVPQQGRGAGGRGRLDKFIIGTGHATVLYCLMMIPKMAIKYIY